MKYCMLAVLTGIVGVLGCSRSDHSGPSAPVVADETNSGHFGACTHALPIESLSINYVPESNKVEITLLTKAKDASETIRGAGPLQTGILANLGEDEAEPIHLKCHTNDCLGFSFHVESKATGLRSWINAKIILVDNVKVDYDDTRSNEPRMTYDPASGEELGLLRTDEQAWRHALSLGIEAERTSFAGSCVGGHRFSTVRLGVDQQSELGKAFHIFQGLPEGGPLVVDFLQIADTEAVRKSTGTDSATISFADREVRVSYPTGEAVLILDR